MRTCVVCLLTTIRVSDSHDVTATTFLRIGRGKLSAWYIVKQNTKLFARTFTFNVPINCTLRAVYVCACVFVYVLLSGRITTRQSSVAAQTFCVCVRLQAICDWSLIVHRASCHGRYHSHHIMCACTAKLTRTNTCKGVRIFLCRPYVRRIRLNAYE